MPPNSSYHSRNNVKQPRNHDSHSIIINPVCIQQGNTVIASTSKEVRLRRFQEEILDFFLHDNKTILYLEAPTGSGKTFATLLPLIARAINNKLTPEVVASVYPTRALAGDQYASVKSTLEELSPASLVELIPGVLTLFEDVKLEVRGRYSGAWGGNIALLYLTSDTADELRKWADAKYKRRALLEAVKRIAGARVGYLVVFTVPEYPYLLQTKLYGNIAEGLSYLAVSGAGSYAALELVRGKLPVHAIDKLREEKRILRELGLLAGILTGEVLFIDEYHVWSGMERATLLALVTSYIISGKALGLKSKIIFSSATPQRGWEAEIIRELVGDEAVSTARANPVPCNGDVARIRGKTVVEMEPVPTSVRAPPNVKWLLTDTGLPQVVRIRSREIIEAGRAYIFGRRPAMVELSAEAFEEETGETPIVVTGVNHERYPGKEALQAVRESGKAYIFGNYSVEIGLDLKDVNYAIVTGGYVGEIIQRIGRVGRKGSDSRVVLLVPSEYYNSLLKRLSRINTMEEFASVLSEYLHHRIPGLAWVDSMMRQNILARARAYLALTLAFLGLLGEFEAGKLSDTSIREASEMYLKVLRMIDYDEVEDFLLRRVARTPEVIEKLASFRTGWIVRYRRGDIEGEASLLTLLANYKTEMGDNDVVMLGEPERKSATIDVIIGSSGSLGYFHGYIVPAKFLMRYCNLKLHPIRTREEVLEKIMRRSSTPLYVFIKQRAVEEGENKKLEEMVYTILSHFSQAILLKSPNGNVVGYLVPL